MSIWTSTRAVRTAGILACVALGTITGFGAAHAAVTQTQTAATSAPTVVTTQSVTLASSSLSVGSRIRVRVSPTATAGSTSVIRPTVTVRGQVKRWGVTFSQPVRYGSRTVTRVTGTGTPRAFTVRWLSSRSVHVKTVAVMRTSGRTYSTTVTITPRKPAVVGPSAQTPSTQTPTTQTPTGSGPSWAGQVKPTFAGGQVVSVAPGPLPTVQLDITLTGGTWRSASDYALHDADDRVVVRAEGMAYYDRTQVGDDIVWVHVTGSVALAPINYVPGMVWHQVDAPCDPSTLGLDNWVAVPASLIVSMQG